MTRTRLLRTLVTLGVAATLVGALFAGPVLAKPPATDGAAIAVPGTVSPSTATHTNYVLFDVSFTNSSSSSMQQLSVTGTTPSGSELMAVQGPFVNGTPQGQCDDPLGTHLSCFIGMLSAGSTATLGVVYKVPITNAQSMTANFLFKTTGATGADKKGRSHGDEFPVSGSVDINRSADFDGSYLFDPADLVVETSQALNRHGNPQSSRATAPEAGIPATIGEVGANSFDCPGASAASCFGQWTVVNVNNGASYEQGFEVVLGYFQVPGNSSNVKFVHLLNPDAVSPVLGIDYEIIGDACTFEGGTVTNLPCIQEVFMTQGNTFYRLLLEDNGPMRGF